MAIPPIPNQLKRFQMKNKLTNGICAAGFAIISTMAVISNVHADFGGGRSTGTGVERGWFWFEDPPVPVEPEPEKPVPPVAPPKKEEPKPVEEPKAPEEKCTKKENWTPECGFVHPGTDFEFQAKQRDALLERMSVA